MYFRSLKFALIAGMLAVCAAAHAEIPRVLKVCADPDNMPFSNRKLQGFENKLAALLARDLGMQLQYEWQRMGRSFVREVVDKSRCELLIGVPRGFPGLLATNPYYRSSYVFVSRRKTGWLPASLNDPALHTRKIGVQVLDDDYAPPAHALAMRGMQTNVVGFRTMGDDAPSIVNAVSDGTVDLAIVWGPLAGYFARQHGAALQLKPVEPEVDPPGLPFTFEISMGVRKTSTALRDRLNEFLARHRAEVDDLLRSYGVPLLPMSREVARKEK